MSFCTVPRSCAGTTPCRSPTTWYMASRIGAVALIVNDVDTRSSGMPSKTRSMSASVSIATPTLPDLAGRERVIRVQAHLRRQVERDREPGLALLEEVAEALVRVLGVAPAGVEAHREQAARGTCSGGCRG